MNLTIEEKAVVLRGLIEVKENNFAKAADVDVLKLMEKIIDRD